MKKKTKKPARQKVEDIGADILKIPVTLDDFKYRKGSKDWGITFALDPSQLSKGQPLQSFIDHHFVLVCVHVEDIGEAGAVLDNDIDLGDIE